MSIIGTIKGKLNQIQEKITGHDSESAEGHAEVKVAAVKDGVKSKARQAKQSASDKLEQIKEHAQVAARRRANRKRARGY